MCRLLKMRFRKKFTPKSRRQRPITSFLPTIFSFQISNTELSALSWFQQLTALRFITHKPLMWWSSKLYYCRVQSQQNFRLVRAIFHPKSPKNAIQHCLNQLPSIQRSYAKEGSTLINFKSFCPIVSKLQNCKEKNTQRIFFAPMPARQYTTRYTSKISAKCKGRKSKKLALHS